MAVLGSIDHDALRKEYFVVFTTCNLVYDAAYNVTGVLTYTHNTHTHTQTHTHTHTSHHNPVED